MAVSRGLPSAQADSEHRTVTLGELRELVAAADGMSDDLIVRGKAIPFYMPDAGNPLGSRMEVLALDEPTPLEQGGQSMPDIAAMFGAAGNRSQRRGRRS